MGMGKKRTQETVSELVGQIWWAITESQHREQLHLPDLVVSFHWSPAGLHDYSGAKLYLYLQILPEKDQKKKARNEEREKRKTREREKKNVKLLSKG